MVLLFWSFMYKEYSFDFCLQRLPGCAPVQTWWNSTTFVYSNIFHYASWTNTAEVTAAHIPLSHRHLVLNILFYLIKKIHSNKFFFFTNFHIFQNLNKLYCTHWTLPIKRSSGCKDRARGQRGHNPPTPKKYIHNFFFFT